MQVHLYFHDDFDGVASCVLAYHLLSALGYKPIIAEPTAPEEVPRKRFREPFALLDLPYNPKAFAYFDHHASRKLGRQGGQISRQTKLWVARKAKSCAELVYGYGKARGIQLEKFKALVVWSKIIDWPLYAAYGISAIETIKPTIPVLKLAALLEIKNKRLTKKIAELLAKGLSFEELLKVGFIKSALRHILKLKEAAFKRFKRSSRFERGLVIYSSLGTWNRFAYAAAYPRAALGIGLVKLRKKYYIKISKNPWRKQSKRMKRLDVGKLLAQFGGGGHRDVGSVAFSSYESARTCLKAILSKLKKF